MQLPVMDNRNQAIKSPDARKISDSQMRCLAKNIACFGIGLYIFAGSDLPSDAIDEEPVNLTDVANSWVAAINLAENIEQLKQTYSDAYKEVQKDKNAVQLIANAKDLKKVELT
jgi:dsRNA-specific ribonuclease